MEKKRLFEFRMPGTGELLSFRNKQYYVEADGRVWNEEKKRYLKQHEREGYMNVCFNTANGKHTKIGVHNLVASVFLRLLSKGENVHHKDHNPKNNQLSNLEIIDGKEHVRMHWADGTMDRAHKKFRNVGTSRPAKQVAQLTKDGQLIRVWPSLMEAERDSAFKQGAISLCCRGKKKTHHGFRWQYLEDYLAQQQTVTSSQPVQVT